MIQLYSRKKILVVRLKDSDTLDRRSVETIPITQARGHKGLDPSRWMQRG